MTSSSRPSDSYGAQLGARVRVRREAAGLSQIELAAKASMSVWELNRLERGNKPRGPGGETLQHLAAALGCPVAELVGGGGSRPPRKSSKNAA